MALSRIWSAFILVAILVAGYRWIFNDDETIFSRMVIGKADDAYDSVSYVMVGSPAQYGIESRDNFSSYLLGYGYAQKDSAQKAKVIIPSAFLLNLV